MKVLALTRYGRLGASSRLRTWQYLPALHSQGIDLEISPLFSDDYLIRLYAHQSKHWPQIIASYLNRLFVLLQAGKADMLWIEKELLPNLPAWFEQALCRLGIRYVVDYDDAIFHNYDRSTSPIKKLFSDKIDRVMRGSALVICGNAYLAGRASSVGVSCVEIVPTVVDLKRYEVMNPPKHENIVIGWIGSPSTVKYLEIVAPALRILASEYPIQLRIVGAKIDLHGLDVDCSLWTEDSEVEQIQDFDIGIMPLDDSPWEKGKCGYKLIQYMACSKPVIASPVGVNCEIVKCGENGYLAYGVDDWLQGFRELLISNNSRQMMGTQGRLLVEQKYCLQVTAPRLAQIIRNVVIA